MMKRISPKTPTMTTTMMMSEFELIRTIVIFRKALKQ